MKNIIERYIKKIKKNFQNRKYKAEIKKQKKKLYIIWWDETKYWKRSSRRDKFKLFKTKLEFDNTFNWIKKISLYYYLIWIFLMLSSAYVVVFSHYFSLKTVDVIRNDELVNIDLAYRSIESIRLKPMVFIDKEDIKKSILSHQPQIKDVEVRKIYPSNIKITIWSFKSLYNTKIEWKYYEITSNWVLIPTNETKENLLKINWIVDFWVLDYKNLLKEEYINKIKNIESLIKANNSFINIKEMVYYKKERELHIIDDKSTKFIFDLTKEPIIQVEKLNIFYKEYLNNVAQKIVYIDLRINERVIYCSVENEFQCEENLKSIYWK